MRKIYYFTFLCIALPSFLAGCNNIYIDTTWLDTIYVYF